MNVSKYDHKKKKNLERLIFYHYNCNIRKKGDWLLLFALSYFKLGLNHEHHLKRSETWVSKFELALN